MRSNFQSSDARTSPAHQTQQQNAHWCVPPLLDRHALEHTLPIWSSSRRAHADAQQPHEVRITSPAQAGMDTRDTATAPRRYHEETTSPQPLV